MKRKSIGMVVVLALGLICFALKAEAVDLTVYNNAGQAMDASVATATGITPETGILSGVAKTIKINALVPATLLVNLSNTQIDWALKQEGTYQAKVIDINASGVGTTDVLMVVQGAANLARIGGTENLATKYALKATTAAGIPDNTSYVSASSFNGSSKLNRVSPDLNVSIWNKLTLPNGTTPGSFADEFTVTFTQAI